MLLKRLIYNPQVYSAESALDENLASVSKLRKDSGRKYAFVSNLFDIQIHINEMTLL